MMKNAFIICTLLVCCNSGIAQSIGIGTTTPAPSAQLDMSSTTKGFLPPRMTTAQRNAIASPAKGLLVYDTDVNTLQSYNGLLWLPVGGTSIPFSLPYNRAISVTTPAFSIDNTGGGKAITASKGGVTNAAIHGRAEGANGIGAKGTITQASGYGVYGANPTGTAVVGVATGSGTALKGTANNQLAEALLTNGNLRLGGNTNPSKGAILTAINNQGDAYWRARPQVAFHLRNISFENRRFDHNIARRILFHDELYDVGENAEAADPNGFTTNGGSFTAPVDGIYAFDYSFGFETSTLSIITDATLSVIRRRAGEVDKEVDTNQYFNRIESGTWSQVNKLLIRGSVQLRLQANDNVFLRFEPFFSSTQSTGVARYLEDVNFFTGRLVVIE